MRVQDENRDTVKAIIEEALKEFSDVQVNLLSESAREAIALRITSDIYERFVLMPDNWPNDARDY